MECHPRGDPHRWHTSLCVMYLFEILRDAWMVCDAGVSCRAPPFFCRLSAITHLWKCAQRNARSRCGTHPTNSTQMTTFESTRQSYSRLPAFLMARWTCIRATVLICVWRDGSSVFRHVPNKITNMILVCSRTSCYNVGYEHLSPPTSHLGESVHFSSITRYASERVRFPFSLPLINHNACDGRQTCRGCVY
jgi:hypothetical protein